MTSVSDSVLFKVFVCSYRAIKAVNNLSNVRRIPKIFDFTKPGTKQNHSFGEIEINQNHNIKKNQKPIKINNKIGLNCDKTKNISINGTATITEGNKCNYESDI